MGFVNRKLGISSASVIILLLLLSVLPGIGSACIGEVAGKISFNVSAGTNETIPMQVFNSCQNQSMYFTTVSQVNPVANVISPSVIVHPKNGILLAKQNLFINITVHMPYNATPGTLWHAGVAVEESSNVSAPNGGATLSVGVVKVFNITALPPLPLPLIDYAIAGVAIAAGAAAAGGLYYFKAIRKPKRHIAKAVRRAPVRRAAKKTAKKKSGRRTSPKRTSRRRRR